VGKEYARCARSNGAAGFPDPQLGQNGAVEFPGADKTEFGQVDGPCGAILRRLPPPQVPPPTPGQLLAMRSFSECMRSQPGAKGFPDPNPDGTFPISGTRFDRATGYPSIAQQRAWNACWHFIDDAGGWRPSHS
jgi:hypothetical protein